MYPNFINPAGFVQGHPPQCQVLILDGRVRGHGGLVPSTGVWKQDRAVAFIGFEQETIYRPALDVPHAAARRFRRQDALDDVHPFIRVLS